MRFSLKLLLAPALVAALGRGAPGVARAETTPPTHELELRLLNALCRGDEPPADRASLVAVLRQYGERWDRVWGVARDTGVWVLEGRLPAATLTEQNCELALEMDLEDGHAQWQVKLARDANVNGYGYGYGYVNGYGYGYVGGHVGGVYRGEYSGTVRGHAVKGAAEARLAPPYRPPEPGFTPAQPGEHPRILFRKSDLERLKARLKTPMGEAAFAKLGGPIGLGMKYQLTGDRTLAEQIIPLVEKIMAEGHHCDQYGHNLGSRLEQTALAYDLCYDAWSDEFKRRVEDYLVWGANCSFHGRRDMGGGINWNIVSNWSAPIYTGAAFAGLALWGEKGPEPPKPPANQSGADVAPPEAYAPGKGVPVCKFAGGQMPGEWIYVAGFKLRADQDALEGLGGPARARPEVGTAVSFGGREQVFRPLSHEKDKGYYAPAKADGTPGTPVIDLTNAGGKVSHSTGYYFTVIDNDAPRWVRFSTGTGAAGCLSGVRLTEGDCVRLAEGLHPLMVQASVDWTVPWGRQCMEPRLTELPEDEAQLSAARRQAEYQEELKDWNEDVAEWKRTGGQDVAFGKVFARGRHDMYVFGREAVGTGGFQGEVSHYSQIATAPPARYFTAYRTMFGYDANSLDDVTMVVPRKMFSHIYPAEGKPFAQEINGYPTVDCGFFSIAFPVIREEWQPAVLWAWNHTALSGGKATDPGVASADASPIYTLLNYPLELQPKPPTGIMPLTWEAPDFGFYAFRNAWEGKEDFIFQVFLKAHTIGGWNGPNAGTFRLLGLGHLWAVGPSDRSRCRWEECVVMLPDNPEINQSACGRLSYLKTAKDGSGVVSIDFSDVYGTTDTDATGRRRGLYERYGNIRKEGALKDSGIHGMRSLGVDYSGRAGAPCLLAVVDKITGGKTKLWMWQLARPTQGDRKGPGHPGALARTKVEGSTFTIAQPDGATLRGTFITRHTLKAEVRKESMIGGAASARGKVLPKLIPGVFAEGGDSFFVVVTVRKGEPPAVRVEGEGLDARVTIGAQKVRFDGEKVIFGD